MKVAVCLSGLTRSFSWCWPLIERYLVRPYSADVFIHTWDIDHGGARSSCLYDSGILESFPDGRTKTEFIDQEVAPADYEIECFNDWAQANNFRHNAQSMYYGIWKAFEIKRAYAAEKNISYDLVIRCRMDYWFHAFMRENEIKDSLENNKLYCCMPGNKPNPFEFVTDSFGFGPNDLMDTYSQTWVDQNNKPCMFEAANEMALDVQLKENNISYEWSKMPYLITNEWGPSRVLAWGDFD